MLIHHGWMIFLVSAMLIALSHCYPGEVSRIAAEVSKKSAPAAPVSLITSDRQAIWGILKRNIQSLPAAAKVALVVAIPLLGAAVVGSAASLSQQSHASMNFLEPSEHTEWKCGTPVDIRAYTYQLGSRGLSETSLDLYDQDGHFVTHIISESTKKLIHSKRLFGFMTEPYYGNAHANWVPPETLQGGSYYIGVTISDFLNTNLSKFKFSSPAFVIKCNGTGVLTQPPAPGEAFPAPSPIPPKSS